MGMRTVRACDVCTAPGIGDTVVKPYTIVYDDGRLKIELCDACAAPLAAYRTFVKKALFRPSRARVLSSLRADP
jgi:hypothetical protein